ncbi:hypothetical protein K0M31_019374 [Melipona bicolor]|uniref:Uncharacterized protein n=1 Tax=Melipona bicolor TaxID=60889 RepID=A0AA40KR13_9HYME|nr:hypothetical protein K0M31_019374 [Melipona bicolor]
MGCLGRRRLHKYSRITHGPVSEAEKYHPGGEPVSLFIQPRTPRVIAGQTNSLAGSAVHSVQGAAEIAAQLECG